MMHGNVVFILLGIAGVASTFAALFLSKKGPALSSTFTQRAEGEWLPEEQFRLTNMLVLSLGACLFAFVPLIEDLFHVKINSLVVVGESVQGD